MTQLSDIHRNPRFYNPQLYITPEVGGIRDIVCGNTPSIDAALERDMARPHLEFIQSQNLNWQVSPLFQPGITAKVLCPDPDGETTSLIKLPAHLELERAQGSWDEEFYVLDGSVTFGRDEYGRHGYAFLPATTSASVTAGPHGALLLYWRHANPAGTASDVVLTRTMEIPWDTTVRDSNLVHLRLARKTLRIGPDQTRTYLLAGLPHGYPEQGLGGMEKHPHAEEMFLVSGDMWAPQGRMTRGAYFYRPPGIWHGHHWSELGFLMVMRNPGASFPITHWADEKTPVHRENPFAPDLPDDAPDSVRRPFVALSDF
jgi:quercetin dioxygenase-like cupin family protein